MKKIFIITFFFFLIQFGYSQEKGESNQIQNNMEQTSILGLRTTIYKVNDIGKARDW